MASEQQSEVPPANGEAEVKAQNGVEPVTDLTVTLHLPERPLLPKAAADCGIAVTASKLPLTLTPTDTLSEIRATLTDVSDCYWLGAYVFRKAVCGEDGKPKKAGGKPVLSDKLPELTDMSNIFDLTSEDKEAFDLYVTHVPYTEAEARNHVIRFRDMLFSETPDPNALAIDAGLTVHDAVRHKAEWLQETKVVSAPTKQQQKKKNTATTEEETQPQPDEKLFTQWETEWPDLATSTLIPEQARKSRSKPPFLRHFALAAWNPPPQPWRLQGHFFYIHAITQENEVFYITASSNGFYVSKTTAGTFDPSPKAGAQASASLQDLFSHLSPLFLQNFGAMFQDPLSTRDLSAVMGITSTQGAYPWLARRVAQHTDPIRSQIAYLLTGGTSLETIDAARDWNEDVQNARELPHEAPNDKQMRDRLLAKFNYEFTQSALRVVPRVAAGEVLPMNASDPIDAHMYVTNNQLFVTRAIDGVGLYPHLGGNEAAHVAVSKDMSALTLVNAANVPGLSTLSTCLVDWKGERWVVQSIVPGLFRAHDDPPLDEAAVAEAQTKTAERAKSLAAESDAVAKAQVAQAEGRTTEERQPTPSSTSLEDMSIVYGSVDGPDLIRSDKTMHNLFSQVVKQFHLAEHEIEDKFGNKHSIWGSVECKGLLGSDGRRYALDLARLHPVDVEWLENDLAGNALNTDQAIAEDYSHKFTVLRLELIESYWETQFREWVAEQRTQVQAKVAELEGEDKAKAIEQFKIKPEEFNLTFNADAFVTFRAPSGDTKTLVSSESDRSVAAVRAASKWLRETAIPRLITDCANGSLQAMDSAALAKHLHLRGINIRYLGLIASLCLPENKKKLKASIDSLDPGYQAYLDSLKHVCELDMVQRGAKHVLRRVLKEARSDEQTAATAHFLNCLLGGARNAHPEAVHLPTPFDLTPNTPAWTKLTPASLAKQVTAEVAKRFRYQIAKDYLEKVPKKQLLRAVCRTNGIQLQLRDYDFAPKQGAEATESKASNQQPTQANGQKKKKSRRAADKTKSNSLANAAVLAAANANTTFVPADVLNLVPVFKQTSSKDAYTDSVMETGRLALARGDYELGLGLMQRAMGSIEQVFGSVHPEVAQVYADYAQTIHTFATTRAIKINEALQAKEAGEEEIPEVPELPQGLEEMLSLPQALFFQRQAVTIAERTYGIDAQETLHFYTNLAVMERVNGNVEEALLCQRRALELWSIIHGPDHPDSISTLNQVASTLASMGKHDAALKMHKTVYNLTKKLFGDDSFNTGQAAYSMSEAYTYTRDLKAAVNYAREAAAIFTARLGAEDPQTAAATELLTVLTKVAVANAKQEKLLSERAASLTKARPQSTASTSNLTPRNSAGARKTQPSLEDIAAEGLTTEQTRELLQSMDINNLVDYVYSSSNSSKSSKKSRHAARIGKGRR